MSIYGKAPGDKPESTERQADIAEMKYSNGVTYNDMRMHQMRIRTMNSYGAINTRWDKYGAPLRSKVS